jgi:hypothetical protein
VKENIQNHATYAPNDVPLEETPAFSKAYEGENMEVRGLGDVDSSR